MIQLEEMVELLIKDIEDLHNFASRHKWSSLSRSAFPAELEQSVAKLKGIQKGFVDIQRETKLLLEKGTPDFTEFIAELSKELKVLEANVSLEKNKKFREEVVNETERIEVPELYSSLQEKIIELDLRARYSAEKARVFAAARKVPFVKAGTTAKSLIGMLQARDEELHEEKRKNIELKRRQFFGAQQEKALADIEKELHDSDKALNKAVSDTGDALKTHLAQIRYVEGSFAHLKQKVSEIEGMHGAFTKKSIDLIQGLKKERDHARMAALEIEQETLKTRSDCTKQMLEFEEKKREVEDKAAQKYEARMKELSKSLEEQSATMKSLNRLVEEQEKEIKRLRQQEKK